MRTKEETTELAFRAWVRSHGLFRQEMDAYFHKHGLSGAQWGVLRTLQRAETEAGLHGVPLGELGRRMIVKAPSVSGVVDRLERQGLVERVASLTDLRSKEVRLTVEGRSLVESIVATHRTQRERVFGCFSATEQRALLKLLNKLETHFETLGHKTAFSFKK